MGVKLHAACHDGYTMMWTYIKCTSPKKPLSELDPEVWLSEDHPRGDVLQKLLQVGAQAVRRFHVKPSSASASSDSPARMRPADLFSMVQATGIRTVAQLRERAHAEVQEGDSRLAEFCTTHKPEEMQIYIDNAWAVHEAPQRALLAFGDRVGKLRAAAGAQCVCGGNWPSWISFVLNFQGESKESFCRDILKALTIGAARGLNLAIVGPPGCGKSTVFEALDIVYQTSAKPEQGSSFPLSGILEAEVLLWQEFSWNSRSVAFEDLLQMLVGEKIAVRVPGAKPVQHRNTAPMFYTAWTPLAMHCRDPTQMSNLNAAMAERFKTRHWTRPLPMAGRLPKIQQCGKCFGTFVLENGK
jgi:hypothetical protein